MEQSYPSFKLLAREKFNFFSLAGQVIPAGELCFALAAPTMCEGSEGDVASGAGDQEDRDHFCHSFQKLVRRWDRTRGLARATAALAPDHKAMGLDLKRRAASQVLSKKLTGRCGRRLAAGGGTR